MGSSSTKFQGAPSTSDVLLLVEVADSSLRFDKRVKLPRYVAAGIPEAWIVNIPEKRLECYRNPSAVGYKLARYLSDLEELTAEIVPELGAIQVRDLVGD